MKNSSLRWMVKMAWRDSRQNAGRLLLFMSSIVIGIAALVAINAFGANLRGQIDGEAMELLGADLQVTSRTPIPDEVRQRFLDLGWDLSEEMAFSSMVYFPKNGGTRLVFVRAVEGGFPYYGAFETTPPDKATRFTDGHNALVDQTLLTQFDAAPGDSVKVGDLTFGVQAAVVKVPGQSAIATTVAPPVFIPLRLMAETGLEQLGSRIEYKLYARFAEGYDAAAFQDHVAADLDALGLRYTTIADRKQQLGDAYGDLTGFLNLTAFIALILGCIGVAGSVHIYLKDKVASVAVLRCLGAKGSQAMGIFMVQVIGMAVIGASVGAGAGVALQLFLPQLLGDFLPVEVEVGISWPAVGQGIITGVVASFLFALLSLVRLRKISPLRAIRAAYEAGTRDRAPQWVALLIVAFVYAFSCWQLGEWLRALYFTLGLVGAFLLLAGTARGVMWLVRRYFPTGRSFVLRQGLANLYRPNNQTLILVVSIGLGTALIALLLVSQDLLIDKVRLSSASERRPNMVLFDIQTPQLEEVKELTRSADLPVLSEVPIVTMRLHGIKGRGVGDLRADTLTPIRSWVLDREYRVSYRDTLSESERLLSGAWQKSVEPGDSILISLEQGLANDMQVELGDEVAFNVQGAIMTTYVGSIRKVDWQRMQTNFLVMFPEGVLEQAPKFHVVLTRFENSQQSAYFQRSMVEAYPNVSIIDLELVLSTVDAVLSKVSFVIRFMAFFSIFTGIVVLAGSVWISKYQRVKESVLLRTLGAQRRHILQINLLEYTLLGSLAAVAGIAIALVAGGLLARFSFETPLAPNIPALIGLYAAITGLTIFIGMANSRDVVRKPPLEILRREG